MAIDTEEKRKSCIGIGLFFLRTGVLPDNGNLEAGQRLFVNGLYSGIAAGTTTGGRIPSVSSIPSIPSIL